MKMRRIVSAEGKAGVVMQVDDLLDTETADRVTNIWGFTRFPSCPLRLSKFSVNTSGLGFSGQRTQSASISRSFPPRRRARRISGP